MPSRLLLLTASLPILITVSLVYLPGFWVNLLCIVDFYTPWVLFDSPLYEKYHNFLLSRLPEREEIPLQYIPAEEATYNKIVELTKGFTFPLVVRGLLENSTALQEWKDAEWWLQNYPNEEVLCGTLQHVVENCNIKAFFDELNAAAPFYISGASEIFDKHPELHDTIDNDQIRSLEPGHRKQTQIFMGFPEMGSDIHSAMGVNMFRMVAGRKKWWFIPPSQTPYLIPSINTNGFSAHTKTLVGKEGDVPSPWLSKIVRYTTVLGPGDMLINPPWFWHGILNLGDKAKNELVIGSPTRYGAGVTYPAAKKSHWLFSVNAVVYLTWKYGPRALKPEFKLDLQADIADNRRSREGKPLQAIHPMEIEMTD